MATIPSKYRPECRECGKKMISGGKVRGGKQQFRCHPCGKWTSASIPAEYMSSSRVPDTETKVTFDEDSGVLLFRTNSPNELHTLEDACEHAGLNPDDFIIEQIDLKTPQQGQKGPDGEPVVLQLFSSHWRLQPKHPQYPLLTPINLGLPKWKAPKRAAKAVEKVAVFGDMHFGFARDIQTGELDRFHDLGALDVVLQILKESQPDKIVCLGDGLDFTESSTRWILKPEHDNTTFPAFKEFTRFWGLVRTACPDADIHYIEGNHDKRLWSSLLEGPGRPLLMMLQEGTETPVASIAHFAKFDDLGITYHAHYPDGYPKGLYWINKSGKSFVAIHGTRAQKDSDATARAVLSDFQHNSVFGHIHKIVCQAQTNHGPDGASIHFSYSFGCLCRIDGIVPSAQAQVKWQQGMGMIEHIPKTGHHTATAVPITNGIAVYQGSEYTANANRLREAIRHDRK